MTDSDTIYDKNGIIIKKPAKNNYHLFFSLENQNIYLEKIINFTMLDIFYALNKDIFEDYKLIIHDDNNASVYFLFKHFMRDLGVPHKYAYINIVIEKSENLIQFKAQTIENKIPENLPSDVELLEINDIVVDCLLETQHKMNYSTALTLYSKIETLDFLEKFASNIFSKIFLRIKQFIENYK